MYIYEYNRSIEDRTSKKRVASAPLGGPNCRKSSMEAWPNADINAIHAGWVKQCHVYHPWLGMVNIPSINMVMTGRWLMFHPHEYDNMVVQRCFWMQINVNHPWHFFRCNLGPFPLIFEHPLSLWSRQLFDTRSKIVRSEAFRVQATISCLCRAYI